MALYLIRCAKAVRRERWKGDDELRPLTATGRAQAAALADWLGQIPISHILSSPFTRCVETVTPLAERANLEVEKVESLAPGTDVVLALAWIRVLPADSVLCSHSAVIASIMEILTRQGAELEGLADWRKGSTWVLERVGQRVVRAHTVAPRPELSVSNRGKDGRRPPLRSDELGLCRPSCRERASCARPAGSAALV
jgi:8-oxo-dGTP diphosphatase